MEKDLPGDVASGHLMRKCRTSIESRTKKGDFGGSYLVGWVVDIEQASRKKEREQKERRKERPSQMVPVDG